MSIDGTKTGFDLSDLPAGAYVAVILANGQQSNGLKFILQR
jgi:hypothetical protein